MLHTTPSITSVRSDASAYIERRSLWSQIISEMPVANTTAVLRGFGHAMSNAVDTRAEHEQAGAPDYLRWRKKRRMKTRGKKNERKNRWDEREKTNVTTTNHAALRARDNLLRLAAISSAGKPGTAVVVSLQYCRLSCE